jgi:hypothetical protein
MTLPGITQIEDSCNHLHVDFAYADGPLDGTAAAVRPY